MSPPQDVGDQALLGQAGAGGGSNIDDTDLKCYWKFNEASGDIINESQASADLGSGADLQVTDASYQTGSPPTPTGEAMLFDGVDDYALAGTSQSQFNFLHNVGAKWTMAWWSKWVALTGDRLWGTMSTVTGARMRAETNGSVEFAMHNDSGGAITLGNNTDNGWVSSGTWYFLCFTWDQTSVGLRMKKDNANLQTLPTQNTPSNNNSQNVFTIAKNADASSHYDNVYCTEWSIWDKVMSDSDQADLYNGGDGLEIY